MQVLRDVIFLGSLSVVGLIFIYTFWDSRRYWRKHIAERAAQGRLLSVGEISKYSGGIFMALSWQGFPGWWEVRFTPAECFEPGHSAEMVEKGELMAMQLENNDYTLTIKGLPRWSRVATLRKIVLARNPQAIFAVYPDVMS